jgi:adenine deaminase
MRILIREGSAAKNYEALKTLLRTHPERAMFCSDDKHPDALVAGHINRLCARAVADGFEVFDVLQAACLNPVRHYRLPTGLLQPGDPATFAVVRDLASFDVLETWVRGERVASGGVCHVPFRAAPVANRFEAKPVTPEAFHVATSGPVRVIRAHNGQLVTSAETAPTGGVDITDDRLLITVVNRYAPAAPAVGFIRGFGLKSGAIASSVAHDSHNIVAVGTSPESLAAAVNRVIAAGGGVSAVDDDGSGGVLPLPVAGLMSNEPAEIVAQRYEELDAFAKRLGSPLDAPFMSLSFMALLVIPSLKLSDLGLFDGATFSLVPLEL